MTKKRRKRIKNIEVEMTSEPMPPHNRGRNFRFPFDKIDVGQGFVVKGVVPAWLSPYIAYAEKALTAKFSTRTLGRHKVGVWRIS